MYFSSVFIFTSILQMQRFSFWARGVHSFGVRWEGTEGVRYGLFCLPLDKSGYFGGYLAYFFLFFFSGWVGESADVETSAAPFGRERDNNRHACNVPPASEPPKPIFTSPHITARKHRTAWNHPHPAGIPTQSPSTQLNHRHPMARACCPIQLARAAVAGWLAGWLWRSIRGV
jgi:hypothetical protein